MSNIKRYRLDRGDGSYVPYMAEAENGGWVAGIDFDSLEADLARLRARVGELEATLDTALGHSNCYCKSCNAASSEFLNVGRRMAEHAALSARGSNEGAR